MLSVVDVPGMLVGIVSEGDFLHCVELGTAPPGRPWFATFGTGENSAAFARTYGRSVDEIMMRDPVCVVTDADFIEAIALMDSHHVAQIPVLFESAVLGIISMAELLAAVERKFDQNTRTGQGSR